MKNEDTVMIRVIRERVDENGMPQLNPYTKLPMVNGGSILLPSLDKLVPGDPPCRVSLEVAKGLLRDCPKMVMLEDDYQRWQETIRKNQARHHQNRDDIRQAMEGSERDRKARARMEQLLREKEAREAEQRAALASSKAAEQGKQAEVEALSESVKALMTKLDEREKRDAENATRMEQLQAELEEAKAKLSTPEKPKPTEPEKPAEPKSDKGGKKG